MRYGMSARTAAALALVIAATIGAGPAAARSAGPVTAYILIGNSSNKQFVLPIDTATGKPGAEIPIGPSNTEGTILATPGGQTLYVANTAGVTAISTSTHKVVRTIPLPLGTTDAAITSDGRTVYATSPHRLYAISTATNKLVAAIKVSDGSGAIAITPDSKTVYVAATAKDTVTPVSTATNRPGRPIPVSKAPGNLTMAPGGGTVYVSTPPSGPGIDHVGYITPISTATDAVGTPIRAGFDSGSLAITPDGRTGYVEGLIASTATPINLVTGTKGKAIRVGPTPEDIVITPDGKTAYVPIGDRRTMVPIDIATNSALAPIKEAPAGQVPAFAALTPNGSTLYAVNVNGLFSSSVTPIRTATNTAGQPIRFTGEPFDMVITS
jgi:DNA-binding beta-propeller fold protein YncE